MLDHKPIDVATLTAEKIISICDHAILHPTQTDAQIKAELALLRAYPLASVCIKPYAVKTACQALAGTAIGVGTVIGFPHGSHTTRAKSAETRIALDDGAVEIDMVINVGKALSHDWGYCRDDVAAVLEVVRQKKGAVLKVIFETDYLTDEAAKIRMCEICTEVGADYVKTSTGFGFAKQADGAFQARGAQDADLTLMRRHSGLDVGVKASGGVRTLADAIRVIGLGVTRIGTTSTQVIYKAALDKFGGAPAVSRPAGSNGPDTGY